jgi:Ni/Co efflux regulator RcnB
MNIRKLLVSLFVIAAVATPVANEQQSRETNQQSRDTMRHVGKQERGPSFSSPQVQMHENGDRVSNYPPYYRPEGSNR